MKKQILSLGGSVVVPDEINVEFLKQFQSLIRKYTSESVFYCIVGGGKTCRKYQAALRDLGVEDDQVLDSIGIRATHLNATLLKDIFHNDACEQIITDPEKLPQCNSQVYIGGGWKPGWSTDYVSVFMAKKLGISQVVNLSNIDCVYDKDPRNSDAATSLERLSWSEFRDLVGDKWIPGANLPFDPIASKLAEKEGISVVVMNGLNLGNLEQYLQGKDFVGTVIG